MLLREVAVSDAPHGHSSGRILRVMKAHWAPPLLCVRPFGGVSLPALYAGLFPAVQSLWDGVLRLLWLLLTSARSPGMLPCKARSRTSGTASRTDLPG